MKLLVLMLLVGCAGDNYLRPTMTRHDREDYMTASGGYLSYPVRMAFRDGRIVSGMPMYLVSSMYPEPDLVIKCPYQSLLCSKILVFKTSENHSAGSISILSDTVVEVNGQFILNQRF